MNDDDRLDPDFVPIVASYRERALTRPALQDVTPELMRERASAEFEKWNASAESIGKVENYVVDLHERQIRVRLYEPEGALDGPLVVHFHGGGWTIGSPELEEAATRRMANQSRIRIMSVDYRLAPEHRFPAAIEDGMEMFAAAANGKLRFAVDRDRIGLSGASSGANIALGTAISLRDLGGPQPAILALLYGGYQDGASTASYRQFGDGAFGLSTAAMDYFWSIYLGDRRAHPDGRMTPLIADLAGLPPVYLDHAELDVLADDSVILHQRLIDNGVRVVGHNVGRGAIHGYTQYVAVSDVARKSIDAAAHAIAKCLAAKE